jgi:Spy/CpxP family protein refolding chaperone
MSTLRKVGLVWGVITALASTGYAQRAPGGPGPGGGGSMELLRNEGVQKELKLSDEQIKQLEEMKQAIHEKYKGEFEKINKLPEGERGAKFQEMRKKIEAEHRKVLAGVLKPEQEKRLEQINLQNEGATVFLDPNVEKDLKLTDEQKESIKTIMVEAQKQMRQTIGAAGGVNPNREEMMKKMQSMRKETYQKAVEVLTESQKKTWKEMTGAPFEVPYQGRSREKT